LPPSLWPLTIKIHQQLSLQLNLRPKESQIIRRENKALKLATKLERKRKEAANAKPRRQNMSHTGKCYRCSAQKNMIFILDVPFDDNSLYAHGSKRSFHKNGSMNNCIGFT